MSKYRITLKSDEQRGAAQPNIVELGFASDGDATQFGSNMVSGSGLSYGICSASFVSADLELSTNYALPYPAGTEYSGRCAFGNAAGYRQNVPWSNCPAGFVPTTRVAALIAAGWLMVGLGPTVGPAPTYGNAQVFTLQPSV